ncbi:hypothetical protein Tco_1504875 [Tanacetum coccineum]
MDMCYELISYPAGFKKNLNLSKQSGNVKRFNANSGVNQSVPSTFGSISASYTNEQMMKLLSLINENPSLSANMSDMFNVVDISSLMLTVDHPSGTLAKITTIGSLRSTNGIVLFDVLVVPEYNVILVSMNKMIMDSKFFVAFDEHKCYIQDLKPDKILGSSSETDGLYLFSTCHPVEQVLSILGKKLGFSKSDHISPCDLCHKAKQTRKPFRLSDHKSIYVGDLVHYDVWSPYRMISKDGYKYFLTIVDDYCIAI